MKNKLYKIANFSSIIWLICIIGVITVIAIASKFFIHDPDFSPGYPENIYLYPILSFFFLGLASFTVFLGTGFLFFRIKGQTAHLKPILGLSIRKVVLMVGIILFGVFCFFLGVRQTNIAFMSPDTGAPITGQEVFTAVNDYRISKGFKPVELDPRICDNLVQRYNDIVNPANKYIGHAGFEKWAITEGLDKDYQLAEIYVEGIKSGTDAILFWESSPGHYSSLIGDYDLGCSYASKGVAIMIFGRK